MNTQEIASYRVPTGAEIREFVEHVNEAALPGRARFVSPMGQHFPIKRVEAEPESMRVVFHLEFMNFPMKVEVWELESCIETRLSFMSPYGSCVPSWLGSVVKGGAL